MLVLYDQITNMSVLLEEMKSISKDAFFIVLQKIGVVIRSFGLAWLLAQLGSKALAAGALTLSQFSICTYFLMGTLAAVSILAAKAKGAGRTNEIGKYVRHGIFLAVFISIPLILSFLVFSHLLYKFDQSREVVATVIDYTKFLAWALLPFSIFIVLQQFLLSISKFKLTTIYSLMGIFLILVCGYILSLGKLGFHPLGIKGLGIAAIIAFSAGMLCLGLHILFGKSFKPFHLFKDFFQFDKHCFYEIWHLGWPLGAKWSVEIGIFMVIAVLIGRHDANQLATQQILLLFIFISGAFSAGIDQATMIRSSHAIGENNFKQVKNSGNAGLSVGLIMALLFSIILLFYFQKIIYLFFPALSEQVTNNFIYLIVLVVLFQFFDSVRTIATGLLATLKDTKFAFWMEIISFWIIGLVIGGTLSKYYPAIFSYWVGLVLGILICAITLLLRYHFKLKSLISHRSNEISYKSI